MSDMEALMWRSEASPRLRSGGVLLDGLSDGRSAYALKLHHSLLDGAAGIQLFDILHSDRPEPSPAKPTTGRQPHRAPGAGRRLRGLLEGVPARAGGVVSVSTDL